MFKPCPSYPHLLQTYRRSLCYCPKLSYLECIHIVLFHSRLLLVKPFQNSFFTFGSTNWISHLGVKSNHSFLASRHGVPSLHLNLNPVSVTTTTTLSTTLTCFPNIYGICCTTTRNFPLSYRKLLGLFVSSLLVIPIYNVLLSICLIDFEQLIAGRMKARSDMEPRFVASEDISSWRFVLVSSMTDNNSLSGVMIWVVQS